jgi:ankyrin repeat protein
MYTVSSYSTDTIERINILLEAGANINIRDSFDKTVLQYITTRINAKGYMDEYDNQLRQHLISRGAQ